MNNEFSIRFDPVDPNKAKGTWEPIEIYLEPEKYNIASWFWENPDFTSPHVVNWAKGAPEDQRALVRAKIVEIVGCNIGDIYNLDSNNS